MAFCEDTVLRSTEVVIIGAGAAGLMCALTAAGRGRKVLLLDHANKAGKKILMSGGGRCNFTNMYTEPAISSRTTRISANPPWPATPSGISSAGRQARRAVPREEARPAVLR
jgi:NADPH-dependent 2,4-dienoyl-CoA reductase/sulfur reductase-like enzyme